MTGDLCQIKSNIHRYILINRLLAIPTFYFPPISMGLRYFDNFFILYFFLFFLVPFSLPPPPHYVGWGRVILDPLWGSRITPLLSPPHPAPHSGGVGRGLGEG